MLNINGDINFFLYFRNNLENVDQGFEDMGEEDDGREDRFERFPDEPLTNPDSSYGRRKSFALNMLAGKAGTSAVVDYNFDDEVKKI